MADEKKSNRLGKKMEGIKEELRSKSLKVAHENAADVQEFTKVKLSFDQFKINFDRVKEIANQGYTSALSLLLYSGSEL